MKEREKEKKKIINNVRVFWLVTIEQKEKVVRLAGKQGISASEVIRNLIKKA